MTPSNSKLPKRARKVLSIKDKIALINDYDKNIPVRSLSEQYGVGKQTVRDLVKKKEEILLYGSKSDSIDGLKNRYTLKNSENPEVDLALSEWFRQERFKKTPVSGEMITEKAKFFHAELNINSEYHYSSGWMEKFKKRNGIRRLKSSGEKECADYVSATMFVEDLKEYIQKEKLTSEQIYNANETSLFWKCLPQYSLACGSERSIEGYKESKERLTALLCANAAGTHKCKLMIIGISAKPRALKNVKSRPVIYKSNKRAWVTQQIFLEWFNNNFLPEVREHMEQSGLERNCKILLLLDNCPAHPDVDAMMSENVVVKYIPPNCTSLIQPMDQGVIRSFKCNYRKSIVQKLLCANSRHEFVKSLNIKIAMWIAAASWDAVSAKVLINVWSNLLAFENELSESPEIQSDIEIPAGCSIDNLSEWMECDTDVMPFAILSDNEIINMVLTKLRRVIIAQIPKMKRLKLKLQLYHRQ